MKTLVYRFLCALYFQPALRKKKKLYVNSAARRYGNNKAKQKAPQK